MNYLIGILDALDKDIFLTLNQIHSPFWDSVMGFFTDKQTWIPLYIFIIGLIIIRLKKKSIVILMIIFASVGLADFITSGMMKPFFERQRPCHQKELADKVHLIRGCGGQFGFASSHASDTFALATILIFLFRKKTKWVWAMLFWAMIISYSRIYAGVHFPFDILVGGMIGGLCGFGFYILNGFLERRNLVFR